MRVTVGQPRMDASQDVKDCFTAVKSRFGFINEDIVLDFWRMLEDSECTLTPDALWTRVLKQYESKDLDVIFRNYDIYSSYAEFLRKMTKNPYYPKDPQLNREFFWKMWDLLAAMWQQQMTALDPQAIGALVQAAQQKGMTTSEAELQKLIQYGQNVLDLLDDPLFKNVFQPPTPSPQEPPEQNKEGGTDAKEDESKDENSDGDKKDAKKGKQESGKPDEEVSNEPGKTDERGGDDSGDQQGESKSKSGRNSESGNLDDKGTENQKDSGPVSPAGNDDGEDDAEDGDQPDGSTGSSSSFVDTDDNEDSEDDGEEKPEAGADALAGTSYSHSLDKMREMVNKKWSPIMLEAVLLSESLDMLNRFAKLGKLARAQFPDNNMDVHKIQSSRDLVRLLPSQHALPSDLFYLKYAKKELLMRDYQARIDQRQIAYVLLDVSSSMQDWSGRKIIYAASAVLALLRRVLKNGDSYYLRFFAGQPYPLLKATNEAEAQELVKKVMEQSFSGGSTHIHYALERAFKDIHEAVAKDTHDGKPIDIAKCQVLLITDADDRFDVGLLRELKGKIKLHSVTVMAPRGNQVKELSDSYFEIKGSDKDPRMAEIINVFSRR